uniref:Uncharacterized protein n=1 Tax=Setaria viridis TaxID=4556 RepID=A0A4U6VQA5_SETVI|nr:hypothetical protein SEVIR_2G001875v2 [Setaria viridis]
MSFYMYLGVLFFFMHHGSSNSRVYTNHASSPYDLNKMREKHSKKIYMSVRQE